MSSPNHYSTFNRQYQRGFRGSWGVLVSQRRLAMQLIIIGLLFMVLLVSVQPFILPASSNEESSEIEPTVATTIDAEDEDLCECSAELDESSEQCASLCRTALATNQYQGKFSHSIAIMLTRRLTRNDNYSSTYRRR